MRPRRKDVRGRRAAARREEQLTRELENEDRLQTKIAEDAAAVPEGEPMVDVSDAVDLESRPGLDSDVRYPSTPVKSAGVNLHGRPLPQSEIIRPPTPTPQSPVVLFPGPSSPTDKRHLLMPREPAQVRPHVNESDYPGPENKKYRVTTAAAAQAWCRSSGCTHVNHRSELTSAKGARVT